MRVAESRAHLIEDGVLRLVRGDGALKLDVLRPNLLVLVVHGRRLRRTRTLELKRRGRTSGVRVRARLRFGLG